MLNKILVIRIKTCIEELMKNEIDTDESIPKEVIEDLALLHHDIEKYMMKKDG
jgi:hypothetical protein